MENKTLQEQIKDAFEKRLLHDAVVSESEIKQISELLYQKSSPDKAVDALYKIIGGDPGENTSA